MEAITIKTQADLDRVFDTLAAGQSVDAIIRDEQARWVPSWSRRFATARVRTPAANSGRPVRYRRGALRGI